MAPIVGMVGVVSMVSVVSVVSVVSMVSMVSEVSVVSIVINQFTYIHTKEGWVQWNYFLPVALSLEQPL
jgi:hypothetical protein